MAQEFGQLPSTIARNSAADWALDRTVFTIGQEIAATMQEAGRDGGAGVDAVLAHMRREVEEELSQ